MKGKIIVVIGILIIIASIVGYTFYEKSIRENSQLSSVNVITAKKTIGEGTVIHNKKEADKYFEIKEIQTSVLVENAITSASSEGTDLADKVKNNIFISNEINQEDIYLLIGKKITRNYNKNEQILKDYLSDDVVEFSEDEREFAIETTYNTSVAGEIMQGDYVDLWVLPNSLEGSSNIESTKVVGPIRVYKAKTDDNIEVSKENPDSLIATSFVFKLNEETIQYLTELSKNCSFFFTKYGVTPTKEQISNATKLENKIVFTPEVTQDITTANSTEAVDAETTSTTEEE